MRPILFMDDQHENFYIQKLGKCDKHDAYHRVLFYTLGISRETRRNIHTIFDSKGDCIKPEGLKESWQTGSTIRLCRLAFNLWNGWTEDDKPRLSSPNELFDCGYAPFFMEAIRLRYPEYCRGHVQAHRRIAEHLR